LRHGTIAPLFLRPNYRQKDGKGHTYWSLVETVRTPDGPRQRTLCYLGELNDSSQGRWLKASEVFNEEGERRQLKLFPSDNRAAGERSGRGSGARQPSSFRAGAAVWEL
jgi:hypothetical protein